MMPCRHFIVLNFHRIHDQPSEFHEGMIELSSMKFREHVEWLGRRVDFVGEADVATLRPGSRPKVLLTFDDGYSDAYDVIAPILEKNGVPATFFVSPGLIDHSILGAWDRIAYMVKKFRGKGFTFRGREFSMAQGAQPVYLALEEWCLSSLPDQGDEFVAELAQILGMEQPPASLQQRELVTWDQVRDLKRRGFAIGGHGSTHRVLSSLTFEEQEEEIRFSRGRLIEEGLDPISFAFPFGSPRTYSWETRELVTQAGFKLIFSFSGQAPKISRLDPTRIDRVAFKSSVAKYDFLLSWTSTYNFIHKFRQEEEE
jgi:peptidoglycan/xylan/chitin deacetylase (PgdA/CDA1 family)